MVVLFVQPLLSFVQKCVCAELFLPSLFFFLQGLKRIGTVRTITIFSMSSVFGLVASGIFLAEQITWHQIMAAGIMILGVYLVSRKDTVISPA